LVKGAQLGDKQCLDRLTKMAAEQLRVNIYRLTLEHDLTQDIVQETILKMLKVLGELKEAEQFWPWLYRIAINKLRLHHRKEQNRRTVPISAMPDGDIQKQGQEAVSTMVGQELKQIVLRAMQALKPEHRTVLMLRCYEEMPYSQIADSMGCSEFGAQMLFYRAKKTLKKQLLRQGFGKGSLLMALALFGKMTAPSEVAAAEVSVTAAAAKVGVTASLVGMVTSKTAVVSLMTAGAIGIGAVAATSGPGRTTAASDERPLASAAADVRDEQAATASLKRWYFFPEGSDGPVMARSMQASTQERGYYCQWLQDEQANYYFDRHSGTVHINNYRQYNSDLAVWRLPTDKGGLTAFLAGIEGETEKMEYVAADGPGLVVVAERVETGYSAWTTRHFRALEEEYIRYSWPAGVEFADNRDPMHKRGWTYFRVEGHINGQRVTGTGRVPFVYAARRLHSPWLRLRVGNRLQIADIGEEALLYDDTGKVVASYAGGSFFKGFARPWLGLHTIDTVRRDAAKEQVPFETKYKPGNEKAEVTLTCREGKLVYAVDMQADVIDAIAISTNQGKEGFLKFSYLQDIEKEGDEFIEPRITRSYRGMRRERPGILWLIQLATGDP